MVSTVTTTTVSTVTMVTATVTFAASLALATVLTLFALLVQKEVAVSTDAPRLRALGRALDIALVPLLLAFGMIAVVRIAQALYLF
jgi:hypothetical protein